jgi:surface protein
MKKFTNQFNVSHVGRMNYGGAKFYRFALFPLMLFMLLLLPAGMVAQSSASSSKYIATYESSTQTLTFKEYAGETLPENSVVVEDKMRVEDMNEKLGNGTIVHIVFDKSFSTYTPTSLYRFFANLTKLKTITGLECLNTEKVTNMCNMFASCSSLTSLDVTHFNTANVTNMSYMFFSCSSLTSLDVTHFNTANVTNMSRMFEYCSSLTSLDVTHFNTAKVTYMGRMFDDCSSLSSLDVTHFNTANVTDMRYMFSSCSSLTSLDVTHFNTANVTNMSYMFSSCSSLTSLDVTHFNTANVTDMSKMFSSCSSLTSLDVTHFNTEKVTNMSFMFSDCSSLTSLDVTHFNTEKVSGMNGMFYSCPKLTSLDVRNFNTANVTNMSYMFSGCSALTTIYASDKFVTTKVSSGSDMFTGCEKLKGYNDSKTDHTYAYCGTDGYFTPVFDYAEFDNATGTLTFRRGLSKPEGAYDLNEGNTKPGWLTQKEDIKKVVFDASFANARPTSCCKWFDGCQKLTEIKGIENLNTQNVTDMSSMFSDCQKLTSLDLSNFNTANVEDMRSMFKNCSALTGIFASNKFVTDMVINGSDMFSGCDKLIGAIKYIGSQTDHHYANYVDGYFSPEGGFPAYAVFDGGTRTLTFGRGLSKPAGAYDLNEGNNEPGWLTQKENIYKVVFDASFANARPTSCYYWFCGCSKLTDIEGIENLNTENVTNMNSMFDRCSALTSLDLTNFNTAKVSDMSYMFMGCSALTTIFVSDKFVTEQVISSDNMFHMCINLIGAIEYDGSKIDHTYANYENGYFSPEGGFHAYAEFNEGTGTLTFRRGVSKPEEAYDLNEGANAPAWSDQSTNISKVVFDASFANARPTSCYKWFYMCTSLTEIEGIENLNTEEVTNMGSMFSGCYDLTQLDLSNFDTQNVENMSDMFVSCLDLKSLNVSNFDTQKVKDMNDMFYHCPSLTSLDVSNFDTQNVEDMSYMFSSCEGLTSLDLSNFDTQKVTDMSDMFWDSSALTTIYVSDKFVTTKVSSGAKMFQGCTNLKGFIDYISNKDKDNYKYANYTTGYFTKLVGKNGEKKIGATGETLATENLVLDDGKDFVAYDQFAAKKASYSRDIPKGSKWGTLCLPFAIDQSQETECKFYRLTGIDNDNDCITLESCEEGKIPAGTPVLFKMNENEQTLSISVQNAGIVKEPVAGTNVTEPEAETASDVNLVGSFTKIGGNGNQGLAEYDYIIGKDKFWRVSDLNDGNGVGIKPMRAYIHPATASQARAAMLSIGKGDGTTAIDNLNAISNDANAEYYDANGRRTNGLQKGLNIVKRGSKTYKIMVK